MAEPLVIGKIGITKESLSKLPVEERAVFLLAGHIFNELMTLMRVTIFTGHSNVDPVLRNYNIAQSMTLYRLLIGKTVEGHKFVTTHVLGTQLGKRYRPLLRDVAQDALKGLNKRINTGMLFKVRNKHSFHNPDQDDIERGFAALRADDDLSIYGMRHLNDSLFFGSAMVMLQTILNDIEGETEEDKMHTLYDEALEATNELLIVLIEVMLVILKEADPGVIKERVPKVTEIENPISIRKFRIPPICSE